MTTNMTIAELLDKQHGRDALIHVLTAMDEHWAKLNNGVDRTTEFWLLAGESVRLLQDVKWLASAIIHVAKLHWANVCPEDDDWAHVSVWHEYTLHPVTNQPMDQIVSYEDEQDEPVIHSMDSARKVLLMMLRMDPRERDMSMVYKLLRGAT